MNAPPVETAPRRHMARRVAAGLVALALLGGIAWLVYAWRASRATAREAREAVASRRFDRARALVEAWLRRDPDAAEAHYLLARIELAEGHSQPAMNELGKAYDLGYPADELAVYRAVFTAATPSFAEAEPILKRALAASSEPMPEVASALARIYLNTFRLREAADPIARWMHDAPNDPTPYLWQNEIDTRRDSDHAVVIQNYREALRRDPSLAKARLGLADRLRQAHRLEEAAEEYDTYVAAHPDDPEGHLGAGRVALERGKFADAEREFERTLELDPRESIALKELGAMDLRASRWSKARDRLTKAIEVDPYDPDLHFNLARADQQLKDESGRKEHDALAQKLREEHARLAEVRSQLVKKPRDPALRLEVMRWMLDHGREAEGLEWGDQILHDLPGHEPTLRALVDHFTRKKDPGKANYYRMLMKPGGS